MLSCCDRVQEELKGFSPKKSQAHQARGDPSTVEGMQGFLRKGSNAHPKEGNGSSSVKDPKDQRRGVKGAGVDTKSPERDPGE